MAIVARIAHGVHVEISVEMCQSTMIAMSRLNVYFLNEKFSECFACVNIFGAYNLAYFTTGYNLPEHLITI